MSEPDEGYPQPHSGTIDLSGMVDLSLWEDVQAFYDPEHDRVTCSIPDAQFEAREVDAMFTVLIGPDGSTVVGCVVHGYARLVHRLHVVGRFPLITKHNTVRLESLVEPDLFMALLHGTATAPMLRAILDFAFRHSIQLGLPPASSCA